MGFFWKLIAPLDRERIKGKVLFQQPISKNIDADENEY